MSYVGRARHTHTYIYIQKLADVFKSYECFILRIRFAIGAAIHHFGLLTPDIRVPSTLSAQNSPNSSISCDLISSRLRRSNQAIMCSRVVRFNGGFLGVTSPRLTTCAASIIFQKAVIITNHSIVSGIRSSSMSRVRAPALMPLTPKRLEHFLPAATRPASTGHQYTASWAFFEALWELGVTHCFVNLGSDHPSIMEAMVRGQRAGAKFPRIITCPNEASDLQENQYEHKHW